MGRYRLTRSIDAPPERVFHGFTDPAVMADWMDMTTIRDMTGDLGTPGTRFTMVVRGPWKFRSQVDRSERARFHEWSGRGPLGPTYRMAATLVARDGGTDLDLVTEYALPLGPIGRWIDRRWLERGPRTIANRELDRLVAIVSGGQA